MKTLTGLDSSVYLSFEGDILSFVGPKLRQFFRLYQRRELDSSLTKLLGRFVPCVSNVLFKIERALMLLSHLLGPPARLDVIPLDFLQDEMGNFSNVHQFGLTANFPV